MKINKKLILSIGLILLIGFLGIFIFDIKPAQAGPIEWAVKGFLYVIGFVSAKLFELLGQLLNLIAGVINGIIHYIKFTTDPIVVAGWTIVRDLTNMFFVLILLIIAFATILRIENYGMKQLLPKLIIAALLINFSLVLAGPIIDFSQILTQFFIDEIDKIPTNGPNDQFAAKIAGALHLPKIVADIEMCTRWIAPTEGTTVEEKNNFKAYEVCSALAASQDDVYEEDCLQKYGTCDPASKIKRTEEELDFKGYSIKDTLNIIMGLVMANIFAAVALFVFCAFVAFLIFRILAIWFLLILAPIAWLFSILPNTQHLFKQWWDTFLKWCFFAPIYMFFVYLALTQLTVQGNVGAYLGTKLGDGTTAKVEASHLLPQLFDPYQLLRFVLVIGMLVGGLIVAQKMSLQGAKGVMGVAKGIRKGATGWSKAAGAKFSGLNALKRYRKASKAAKEDAAKEKRARKMKLRKVGGAKQWARERLSPTAKGRAEARSRKNLAINQEATRMSQSMNLHDVRAIASKRTSSLTSAARAQKLAALKLLSDPKSEEYKKVSQRTPLTPKTPPLTSGTTVAVRGWNKIKQLRYNARRSKRLKSIRRTRKKQQDPRLQERLQRYQ